jgi:hypothetical protein
MPKETILAMCSDGVERHATVASRFRRYSACATVNAHGCKVNGFVFRETPGGMLAPEFVNDEDARWFFCVRTGSKYAHVLPSGNFNGFLRDTRELAQATCEAQARWAVDGNSHPADVLHLLSRIEVGDPGVWDDLPARPNLRGEWAESLTPRLLTQAIAQVEDPPSPLVEALAQEYERTVEVTYERAVLRVLNAWVPEPSSLSHEAELREAS